MRTKNISVRLVIFLIGAVAISASIAGVLYAVLHQVQTGDSVRIASIIESKNSTYLLLETMVDAQATLQETLRLKDPDEIEKGIAKFKAAFDKAQKMVEASTTITPAIREKLKNLGTADQEAIDKFVMGENSEAFEVLITVVPVHFSSVIQAIREHSATIEAAMEADQQRAQTSIKRKLTLATIACSALLAALLVFGWHFRRSIIEHLGRLADSLGSSSKKVSLAADQVSTTSQQLADGASQQASSLEESSASLNEMASMTKRNAESAARANELARHARTAADLGSADMDQMLTAMHAIKTASDDIAKIIQTIDEIAFQTNILALNAAVEAARAGSEGMGFAVVADEVRALAQRSANAARETAAKIETAIAKTNEGVHISARVAKNLSEIVDTVRKVDELVTEVAKASGEQNDGVSQINTAVLQIDTIVQNNAASAEESAAAALELKSQASALEKAVAELNQMIGAKSHPSEQARSTQPPQPADKEDNRGTHGARSAVPLEAATPGS